MKSKLMNIAEAPETHLGFLTQDITRLLRAEVHRRIAALGLTRAQLNLLSHLFQAPGCTQRSLAERLEIEPAPVGRMIDDLEKSGWVERRRDPNDRRAWQLFIPEALQNTVIEIEAQLGDIYDAAFQGLSERQLNTLFKALSVIRDNLANYAGSGSLISPDSLTLPAKMRQSLAQSQSSKNK